LLDPFVGRAQIVFRLFRACGRVLSRFHSSVRRRLSPIRRRLRLLGGRVGLIGPLSGLLRSRDGLVGRGLGLFGLHSRRIGRSLNGFKVIIRCATGRQ
jgi:hypothetical protein